MTSQLVSGDEIIVTVSDHESNIGPWAGLEGMGIKIRTWNIDRDNAATAIGRSTGIDEQAYPTGRRYSRFKYSRYH